MKIMSNTLEAVRSTPLTREEHEKIKNEIIRDMKNDADASRGFYKTPTMSRRGCEQ